MLILSRGTFPVQQRSETPTNHRRGLILEIRCLILDSPLDLKVTDRVDIGGTSLPRHTHPPTSLHSQP